MRERCFYLDKPASAWGNWESGFPLGNGRLGAMVMGEVSEEIIVINEETLWYGPMRNRKNKDSLKYLDRVRELLMAGEVEEAAFLQKMAFMSTPKYNNPYQKAGDLRLCFKGHRGEAKGYRRTLDISSAQAEVVYAVGGYNYRREYIVSRDYNVLAVRITTDSPKGITMCASLNRKPFEEHSGADLWKTKVAGSGAIPMIGNWGQAGAGGIFYLTAATASAVPVRPGDEPVSLIGDSLFVEHAREVVVYLTALTDFSRRLQALEKGEEYNAGALFQGCPRWMFDEASGLLGLASASGYREIHEGHLKHYRSLYGRFSLEFGTCPAPSDSVSMDRILEGIKMGRQEYADDIMLFLVDYARYLMICSSDSCLLPANLQGIWNGSFEPPWQSQFTININFNMNYWFVPKVGLAECEKPFHALVQRIRRNGRETARQIYGCGGFCAHHNTNLWACTDIEGIFDSSPFWVMGAAWLCLQLYDNYLYHQDRELLDREILPTMREAIAFFEDYLYEAPDGTLLTGPSVSPENTYETKDGQRAALCMAPTMDISILRQLIDDYQEGLAELGREREQELDRLAERLPGFALTEDGRIREWYEDVKETDPGHRHVAHLFGLHPGKAICADNPELFQAAGATLDRRLEAGSGHTGWSKAWICCLMARLHRGEAVRQNLFEMLQHCILDNLLDTHPPFQIDGNFGIPEAVLECIAQCHTGCIELLPCLPARWNDGKVVGFGLRRGITMDMEWKDGKVVSCRMKAVRPVCVTVKYCGNTVVLDLDREYQEIKCLTTEEEE